jgi:hypothetical protein
VLSKKTSKRRVPRVDQREASIALRDDGGLTIAVVADTHSRPHPDIALHLTARSPDVILHAGDIGDLVVLDGLRKVAPVIAVRGNIDERVELPDVITLGVTSSEQRVLTLLLMHIAVYGPKIRADAARLARAAGANLIVCGHSHVPFIGRDQGLTVFNPGSIGPRRFTLPIVFGMIEIAGGKLTLHHVSCETGERWEP